MTFQQEFSLSDTLIELLLDKAEEQGKLTLEEIESAFIEKEVDPNHLKEISQILQKQGIEIEQELEEEDFFQMEDIEEIQSDMDPYVNTAYFSGDDTISIYLKEMSIVPLLSAEEEVSLAKRYESGKNALNTLARLDGNCTPRKREKLESTIGDGQMAREHLIKANTRLVVSVAKRYTGRGVPFLDLIQEGNLGLMKAVEKFDYARGFRFSTYATWWIRQTITRAIADQGRTIRVPVHMVDRIRLMYKYSHQLEQQLGRAPTVQELAEAMDIDIRKVGWMLQVSWLPLSLESPVNEGEDDSELGNFVEDRETPTPIQTIYSKLLQEKVRTIIESLPCREARILRLRFGLEDGRFYTLEEVGKKFKLTRERIRQIETKALRKLRHPRRSAELRDFVNTL